MFIFSGGGTTRSRDLRPRRLLVEPLEERQLLSVVDLIDLVETPKYGSATDHFSISENGAYVAYLSGGHQGFADSNGVDDIFARDVQAAAPVRVSTNRDGNDAGNGISRFCAMSADGQFVAFMSYATDLVPGNPNACTDIYVRDWRAQTPTTTRVSTSHKDCVPPEAEGDGNSDHAAISQDGRYVAFESLATNLLVEGDTNGRMDVFVKDTDPDEGGTTKRASSGSDWSQLNAYSAVPAISQDGRYVAFESIGYDGNGDPTGPAQIYLKDMQTGTLTPITTGNRQSVWPVICGDGRKIVFHSLAGNLVPGETTDNYWSEDVGGKVVEHGWDVFLWDSDSQTITRLSKPSDGLQANGDSDWPSISENGRLVAFESNATNLVTGDNTGKWDIFVKDVQTESIVRVGTDSTGIPANGNSYNPAISGDGKYVAFESYGTNLVSAANDGVCHVFRVVNPLAVVNLPLVDLASADGTTPANGCSENTRFALSENGRYVALGSSANNLLPPGVDTNGCSDIFVKDWGAVPPTINRASTPDSRFYPPRPQADGGSSNAAVATYVQGGVEHVLVAFESLATNLNLEGDTNGYSDIFVKDMYTGYTTRVSTATGGTEANGPSYEPAIAAFVEDDDVHVYVAFASDGTNLVGNDYNYSSDVFVKDMETGETTRVSTDTGGYNQGNGFSGHPAISADGRLVAFESYADNLVSGDTNASYDIFVKNRETGGTARVSVATGGDEGDGGSYDPAISPDGSYVTFDSAATNLVDGDTNGNYDTFVRDRDAETTIRVNTDSMGNQATGSIGYFPSASIAGRYVAFASGSSNLVSSDNNNCADIFVKDVRTGRIGRVTTAESGSEANGWSSSPAISADGLYIAFSSGATNLVPGDTNNQYDVFRVSNPLLQIIDGTSQDDLFAFSTDATNLNVSVDLDGWTASWTYYNPSHSLTFTFNGRGGNDEITVVGGPDDESAVTCPNYANLTGPAGAYQVIANDFGFIDVTANFGDDQPAAMYDTPGADDTFTSYPDLLPATPYYTMTGAGYAVVVTGFGPVAAYASGDAGDRCDLYDSSGADEFTAYPANPGHWPSKATMDCPNVNPVVVVTAEGFTKQYGYGHAGDGDTAEISRDGPGNDTWVARGWDNSSEMSDGTWNWDGQTKTGHFSDYSYLIHADGFDYQKGSKTSDGTDVAKFYDTAGNDQFVTYANGTQCKLNATATVWEAWFFQSVYAYAVAGGYDTATLNGTTGADAFTAYGPRSSNPAKAMMSLSNGRYFEIQQFDEVYASLLTGNDTANLYDSDGAATDTFWGKQGQAVLSDGTLNLTNGNLVTAGTYYYKVAGFDSSTYDHVNLFGSTAGGTNNKKVITPLDYVLAVTGPWTDL